MTTHVDFSGRSWVDKHGGWVWCAPKFCKHKEAQIPGKDSYEGCRFCGGGDHRAVDCTARWRASMAKLIGRMAKARGNYWVQNEVKMLLQPNGSGQESSRQKKTTEDKKKSKEEKKTRNEEKKKKREEKDKTKKEAKRQQQEEDSRRAAAGAQQQEEDSRRAAQVRSGEATKERDKADRALRAALQLQRDAKENARKSREARRMKQEKAERAEEKAGATTEAAVTEAAAEAKRLEAELELQGARAVESERELERTQVAMVQQRAAQAPVARQVPMLRGATQVPDQHAVDISAEAGRDDFAALMQFEEEAVKRGLSLTEAAKAWLQLQELEEIDDG